jgi:hypothetical protein
MWRWVQAVFVAEKSIMTVNQSNQGRKIVIAIGLHLTKYLMMEIKQLPGAFHEITGASDPTGQTRLAP